MNPINKFNAAALNMKQSEFDKLSKILKDEYGITPKEDETLQSTFR